MDRVEFAISNLRERIIFAQGRKPMRKERWLRDVTWKLADE